MANKRFLLGMLVMVLALGMAVVACDNDTTSGSGSGDFGDLDLNTTPPDNSVLEDFELELTQFNQIRNAGGAAAFQGWVLTDYEELMLVWSNRNIIHFTAVADVLKDIFGENEREPEYGYAWGDGYDLQLFDGTNGGDFVYPEPPSGYALGVVGYNDDFDWPAGTLVLWLWGEGEDPMPYPPSGD